MKKIHSINPSKTCLKSVKLVLKREAIRSLADAELQHVAGGASELGGACTSGEPNCLTWPQ